MDGRVRSSRVGVMVTRKVGKNMNTGRVEVRVW